MNIELPYGVIFDMDGVLVDSEELICEAICQMFAEAGLHIRLEDFGPFVGTGESRCLGGIAEKYHFPLDIEKAKTRTYDIYLDSIRGDLKLLPGAYDFINTCRKRGKKLAVASSADRRKVMGNLREIGLDETLFEAIIAGEDVVHKKPAPDIFLLAIDRLHLKPDQCLVIEDAVSGVAAAKAAGAKCLALTTSFPEEKLTGADFFAPNLAHVSEDVLNWPK
jgi:HAD superfamily hydrolase (TIGR01509 family)